MPFLHLLIRKAPPSGGQMHRSRRHQGMPPYRGTRDSASDMRCGGNIPVQEERHLIRPGACVGRAATPSTREGRNVLKEKA